MNRSRSCDCLEDELDALAGAILAFWKLVFMLAILMATMDGIVRVVAWLFASL